jgi:hypothetical protein
MLTCEIVARFEEFEQSSKHHEQLYQFVLFVRIEMPDSKLEKLLSRSVGGSSSTRIRRN